MWHDDYWVLRVSESHIERVRKYIHNQEQHHAKRSFRLEIDSFMRKYDWELIKER